MGCRGGRKQSKGGQGRCKYVLTSIGFGRVCLPESLGGSRESVLCVDRHGNLVGSRAIVRPNTGEGSYRYTCRQGVSALISADARHMCLLICRRSVLLGKYLRRQMGRRPDVAFSRELP